MKLMIVIAQNLSSTVFFHIRQPVQTAHRRQRSAQLSNGEVRQNVIYTVDRKCKQIHHIREINRFNIVN